MTLLSSAASIHFQTRSQENLLRGRVRSFVQDIITAIHEYAERLEDNRDRNRVIDREFLDLIQSEIDIQSRNREYLIQIDDPETRAGIRTYFTRMSAIIVRMRVAVAQFNESWEIAQNESVDVIRRDASRARDNAALTEAHRLCDKLREVAAGGRGLAARLR